LSYNLMICEDNVEIDSNDNQNNLKSTIIEDNISSQIITSTSSSTTDMNIETTINPVTMLLFIETTYNTNDTSLIDNDVGNLTTDSILLNDTTLYDNEKNNFNNDIPQFLLLATDEGRKVYYEIQQNINMKKYNIDKVTKLWAQEQGEIVNNHIETIIAQLPEEAQEIHKKIEDILDNVNITKVEEEKLITDLLTSVNQTIVNELTKLNLRS
uniref:SXP/RAL-2 family protein Ani s 5-like cation-binding domain-containing protein n=2 Tax=Strongyloides stercoralis TaxID=6248 RepID=A0AAF5DLI9_STRER